MDGNLTYPILAYIDQIKTGGVVLSRRFSSSCCYCRDDNDHRRKALISIESNNRGWVADGLDRYRIG